MIEEICPFCQHTAEVIGLHEPDRFRFKNCLCENYIFLKEAWRDKEYEKYFKTDKQKILFSGYLRNNPKTIITDNFIGKELNVILEYCEAIPLEQKINDLKQYLYDRTTVLGRSVYMPGFSFNTFYLQNDEELFGLIKYLEKTGFIVTKGDSSNKWETPAVTVEGYSEIEAGRIKGAQSNKVFIACEFNTDYQSKLVEVIQMACLSCGFDANLVSGERHNENISNKIIADIKKSKFMIADFTEQNNGVYFEAGYAMGMRKEVIRLIRKGDIGKLHFDTKQFNHIEWEDEKWQELMEALIAQIEATIIDKKSEHSPGIIVRGRTS